MKFPLYSLCAALACKSVTPFVPCQPRHCAFSRGTLSTSSDNYAFSSPCVGARINGDSHRYNVGLQMVSDGGGFVKADDGEALQSLFSTNCDKDGLMTKEDLQTKIVVIKELLVSKIYCIPLLPHAPRVL